MDGHGMGFEMLGNSGSLVLLVFIGVLAALAFTAYVNDVLARRWGWLIAECIVPPIAVIRGLLIWFNDPAAHQARHGSAPSRPRPADDRPAGDRPADNRPADPSRYGSGRS